MAHHCTPSRDGSHYFWQYPPVRSKRLLVKEDVFAGPPAHLSSSSFTAF